MRAGRRRPPPAERGWMGDDDEVFVFLVGRFYLGRDLPESTSRKVQQTP